MINWNWESARGEKIKIFYAGTCYRNITLRNLQSSQLTPNFEGFFSNNVLKYL